MGQQSNSMRKFVSMMMLSVVSVALEAGRASRQQNIS